MFAPQAGKQINWMNRVYIWSFDTIMRKIR